MDEESMEIETSNDKTPKPNADTSVGDIDSTEINAGSGGDCKLDDISGSSNDSKNGPCNADNTLSDSAEKLNALQVQGDAGTTSSHGSKPSSESVIDHCDENGEQKKNKENVIDINTAGPSGTSATNNDTHKTENANQELPDENLGLKIDNENLENDEDTLCKTKKIEADSETEQDDCEDLLEENLGTKSESENYENLENDQDKTKKIEAESKAEQDPQSDIDDQDDSLSINCEEVQESIDLELEDEKDQEEQHSDAGVQEIHDIEDEEEEKQDDDAGSEQETDLTEDAVPKPIINKFTLHQEVQILSAQKASLQSELEETKKKLTRAEKKLNRSRRHKESAESYNYDLRKRVKHLKKELHRFRKAAKKTFAEVGCQTTSTAEAEHDDIIEIPNTSAAAGSSRNRGWGAIYQQHAGATPLEDHLSLADSLKATAEEALSNSGYVLDPNSGLYYDYSTGYYYDPNNHLYYDPNTGVYYYYDQRSRTYQFHSQVTVDPSGMLPHTSERPRRGKRKKDRRQRREVGEDEDMECEVIEVPDDDSPEYKRPKKSRHKQKQKAPHTATTGEDINKEGDNQESTAKDADNQKTNEKELDNPKSPRKGKTSQKKAAKKSTKSDSSDQKMSESRKEDKEKDKMGDKEKDKMEEKEKEKTSNKEKDKTVEIEKDKTVGESSKENQETESREMNTEEKSSDPEPPKEQEPGSAEKEGSNKEPEKESTQAEGSDPSTSEQNTAAQPQEEAENAEKTADPSTDEANPSVPDETKQDSSSSSSNQKKVGGDDAEIMEVESKREEIEEITILDSDDDDSEMEEGELTDSSAELTSSEESSECESDVIAEHASVTKQDFPPCIRMIVTRSDKIQLGCLFIVTYTGGTIGREGNSHVVTIPELGVSKQHAAIKYNVALKQYNITDLGSQNGTLINGKLLSKARSVSEPHPLTHKDYLTVGSTTLRVHIHPGDETCDECEPGQVQALFAQLNPENNQVTYTVASQADKEQMRRKELRKLKKKYNLVKDNYVHQDASTSNPAYTDRAGVRRKAVGSDNPYQKDDAPASVDRAISETNVGRKMLEKMGWKEGKGLGKGDSGIKEPIQVLVHSKKSGLGAGVGMSMDQAQYMAPRRQTERWQRTKARFDKLQGESSGSKPNAQLQWVSGGTEELESSRNESESAGNDADAQEDCIEILSPGSEEDHSLATEAESVTASSLGVAPTDTTSGSSASIAEASSSSVTTSNPSTSPRPKIQLKLLSKKGEEQLPSSSVVLDDDDDNDVEAMEVIASGENNAKDSSVTSNSSRSTRASIRGNTRWENSKSREASKTQNDNKTDNPAVGSTNNRTDTTTEQTPLENAQSASQQGTEETKSSAKSKSAGNKWVKIGDGKKKNENKKDEAGGDGNTQENETGMSGEGVSDASQMDAQKEPQSDAKGRKRRTRKATKKKEDMFADL